MRFKWAYGIAVTQLHGMEQSRVQLPVGPLGNLKPGLYTILMTKPKNSGTAWQFALINNKLAEVFFSNGKVLGHCYIQDKDYKTKEEKKWIANDTKRAIFSYRNRRYKDKLDGKVIKSVDKL